MARTKTTASTPKPSTPKTGASASRSPTSARKPTASKPSAKRKPAARGSASTTRPSTRQKPGAKRSSARGGRSTKGLAELAARMKGIDLCMMTTHADDGSLHSRPMSNNGEVEFDGDAWFFSGRETPKVAELQRDGTVCLTYAGGTKREPVWIAVYGTASIDDDEQKKSELWVKELDRWFPGGPEDPDVVLIHVEATRATWWSGEDQGELDLA